MPAWTTTKNQSMEKTIPIPMECLQQSVRAQCVEIYNSLAKKRIHHTASACCPIESALNKKGSTKGGTVSSRHSEVALLTRSTEIFATGEP